MRRAALLVLVVISPAWASSVVIPAIDSTTRYKTEGAYWWTSDHVAAQSSYASGDGHLTISEGYIKFFAPPVQSNLITSAYLLTTVEEIRQDRPGDNPPPSVGIFRVYDNSWTRQGNTYIPYSEQISEYQDSSYTSWALTGINWAIVESDGFLSLAFHNQTVPVHNTADFIYNHLFLYGTDTSARPQLVIEYAPEPTSLLLLVVGGLSLTGRRARHRQ